MPSIPNMTKNVQQIRTTFPIGRKDDNKVITTNLRPGARLITLYTRHHNAFVVAHRVGHSVPLGSIFFLFWKFNVHISLNVCFQIYRLKTFLFRTSYNYSTHNRLPPAPPKLRPYGALCLLLFFFCPTMISNLRLKALFRIVYSHSLFWMSAHFFEERGQPLQLLRFSFHLR